MCFNIAIIRGFRCVEHKGDLLCDGHTFSDSMRAAHFIIAGLSLAFKHTDATLNWSLKQDTRFKGSRNHVIFVSWSLLERHFYSTPWLTTAPWWRHTGSTQTLTDEYMSAFKNKATVLSHASFDAHCGHTWLTDQLSHLCNCAWFSSCLWRLMSHFSTMWE